MENKTINQILIPMDFSETGLLAMEHGAFMARLFKANLYLLHVLEPVPFSFSLVGSDLIDRSTLESEMENNITNNLNLLAKKVAEKNDIQVIPLIARGRIVRAIEDASKEHKIDVIVMGTHGAKGFEEYFIGSNAHKTVTVSPCPVITIQTHTQHPGFNKIVMPIDNSLHSRQKVDTVIKIAKQYEASIHLLGLINMNEDINENKFNIKIDSVEKAIKNAKLPYVKKIVKGENIAVEVMKYSDEINADLIVIMTEHESNLTGMFLGGFAKQIVNHSRIPVMSIRPIEGNFAPNDQSSCGNPFG